MSNSVQPWFFSTARPCPWVFHPEAPWDFHGRPDPSIRQPRGGWGSQTRMFEGPKSIGSWADRIPGPFALSVGGRGRLFFPLTEVGYEYCLGYAPECPPARSDGRGERGKKGRGYRGQMMFCRLEPQRSQHLEEGGCKVDWGGWRPLLGASENNIKQQGQDKF